MNIFEGVDLAPSLASFKRDTNNSMRRVKQDSLTPIDNSMANNAKGVALKTSRDTGLKGTVTNYKDTVVNALDGIIGAISGGFLNTKDITKAIKVGRDGVTFDENNILKAVSTQLGYPVTSQSGAMRQVANDISKEFNRITGLNIGKILTSDGKTFKTNKNWRGQMGGEVFKELIKFTDLDEFIDVSVKSSVYNSLYYNAARFGMRDSYRHIWKSYPTGFGKIRRDATLEALQYMITNGDIDSIDEVLKILDEDDGGLTTNRKIIAAKFPNFIEVLFSNFKFDDDVYPEDYPAVLEKLLSVLERIKGPNWWMTHTEFGPAYNLAIMTRTGKDMKTLLSGYDPLVPLLCTIGFYNQAPATNILKTQFRGVAQFPY